MIKIYSIKNISVIITALFLLLAGCGKKSDDMDSRGYLKQSVIIKRKLPVYVPPTNPPEYVYLGGAYRDPFIPIGMTMSNMYASSASSGPDDVLTAERIGTLKLKGIIRWKKDGEVALIADTMGGSYTLRQGKLYNRKSSQMKGITGTIGANSVTLFSGGTRIELKLKKSMGE